MWATWTGSIQTDCQMPVTAVYMIPCGLFTCLPRGCQCVSVGSQTLTINSCCFSFLSIASVALKENREYPPRWEPSVLPLSVTSHSQSTASKCNNTCWSFQFSGIVNWRRYQSVLSFPTSFITPESADSAAKGTRMFPSHCFGWPSPFGRIA